MFENMMTSVDATLHEPCIPQRADDFAPSKGWKTLGHRSGRYGEMFDPCFDIIRYVSSIFTIDLHNQLNRFAGIGHRLLEGESVCDDLRKGRHENRVSAFWLRLQIDRESMLARHDASRSEDMGDVSLTQLCPLLNSRRC